MTYEERLQNVTVLGSAGKMGSGILLLTAVEMADINLKPENRMKTFVLNAMDVSHKGLSGLMSYLNVQVRKIAEKKILVLRQIYQDRADLIENFDIVDQYVRDVLNVVRPTTALESAYESTMVFEAINENEDLKIKLFSQIDQHNPNKCWFFTNTSSIPIHVLNNRADLSGRIIGFHFYNPPAVQKLVEIICSDKTLPELTDFANLYAKNLKKVVVPSNDVAGFIGNGFFMRDILHAVSELENLQKEMSLTEAIYCMNKVSQDYLIRPMGIFQLIDYVGIDVCQFILKVMQTYLTGEKLHSELLDKLISLNVRGGQNSDGSQKDGFLKYEKNRPVAVFDMEKIEYTNIPTFQVSLDNKLGKLPDSHQPWKSVVNNPGKNDILKNFFKDLKSLDSLGSKLALTYAKKAKDIGLELVKSKIAKANEDVNIVMMTGFFHSYGPVNDLFD